MGVRRRQWVDQPSYLLRAEFAGMLSEDEIRLTKGVQNLMTQAGRAGVRSSVRAELDSLYRRLGGGVAR